DDYAYIGQNGEATITNDTATVSVKQSKKGSKSTVTTAVPLASATTSTTTSSPLTTATTGTTGINTTTQFRATNLSVSNHTGRVGDEITVTVWVSNPTDSRLKDEIALA